MPYGIVRIHKNMQCDNMPEKINLFVTWNFGVSKFWNDGPTVVKFVCKVIIHVMLPFINAHH